MTAGRMSAAAEIGRMVSRIMELAPKAGLHVRIKITPAIADTHPKDGDVKQAPLVSGGGARSAIAQKDKS